MIYNTDTYNRPHFQDMSYTDIPTPPSSNEDSPGPVYYLASPNSASFSSPDRSDNSSNSQMMYLNQDQHVMAREPYPQILNINPLTPCLTFIEEPIERFRFRYKSEMAGTHGSLTGRTSDKSKKQTFPTVELRNFNQPAIIRCSIYQSNAIDRDFMPHAHRLVKKQGREEIDDPHDVCVSEENGYRAVFHSMGIIHTAKKNVVAELVRKKTQLKRELIAKERGIIRELTVKEEVEIKAIAEAESKTINLNIVCLRFDAFVSKNGILHPICPPLYSKGINNLKSALTGELKIVRMDHCTSPSKGNREIFLLVERVTKKNIKVRFFELDDNDDLIWEDEGKFSDLDVHHQYAIVLKTPKYKDVDIKSPVKVFIELLRPSDQARSEPKEFTYTPCHDNYKPGSKRCRTSYSSGDSYDSSNIGSGEIPLTVNEMDDMPIVTSEDLKCALENINSEEFGRLYDTFSRDIGLDAPRCNQKIIIKEEINTELDDARNDFDNLRKFFKTKPEKDRVLTMLKKLFGNDLQTNSLHTFIAEGLNDHVHRILKLIFIYKQNHLVNNRNSRNETPLQLAVMKNNKEIINELIRLNRADVRVVDSKCNTLLHLAVVHNLEYESYELLFPPPEENKNFIDLTNNDGYSALHLAIKENKFPIIKLLCIKGANVNLAHKCDGYTPLRFAIQNGVKNIVKYLLEHPNLDAAIQDFNGISVFQAAVHEASSEILDILEDYAVKHNINCQPVVIKQEVQDSYDDHTIEEEEVAEIKMEIDSVEDLYRNVVEFTPECLDKISTMLDASGNWENLADLLDLSTLVRSRVFESNSGSSMSKQLLKYAVTFNNDSVLIIRNFLEVLGERDIVNIIDDMARSIQ